MTELQNVNFFAPGADYHLLVDLVFRDLPFSQVQGIMRDKGYEIPEDQFETFKKLLNMQMVQTFRADAAKPKMKSWFVKTESVTTEEQFELLVLATETEQLSPAKAVEGPLEVATPKKFEVPALHDLFRFFGVDAFGRTLYENEEVCFDNDDFKNSLGQLTYQQAWDYLTTGVEPVPSLSKLVTIGKE